MAFLSLTALEWLLRSYVFDPNQAYIRTPGWAMLVRTNDLIPNVAGEHLLQVNRLGIRGPMPRGDERTKIAVLGGSTVEDWALGENKTWAQQLAWNLRDCAPDVWVGNLGKGGVNARHHLLQLPAIEAYMPRFDAIVVLLGLNDFLFDLRIHHPFQIPPDWWNRQAFMSLPGDEGTSALLAISAQLWGIVQGRGSGSHGTSDFGHYQKHLRDAYARVTAEQKVGELPDLSAHLATYRRTISALKAYADKYGAPIVFVSQPFAWSDSMSPETKAQIYAGFIGHEIDSPLTRWYTAAALEKGLSAYNSTLMEMCSTEKLSCVDAAAQIPREARYFYDDFHFSERGAALLGKLVAPALRPHAPDCRTGSPGAR